ncbi:Sc6p-like and SM domain-containing protein [Cryptosporidium hominis]
MVHEYIGSKITIISRNDKRYEGVLHSIDVDKSTITLKDVRYFENGPNGTPGPASSTVFEMIVFRGSDITDLAVCQPAAATNNNGLPNDPAILSVNGGSGTNSAQSQGQSHVADTSSVNQQKPLEASPSNSRRSPKMSYSNAVSGGKPSSTNQGSSSISNGRKDHSRNRQRGGGYSGKSYKGSGGSSHYNNGGGSQRSFIVGELKPRINQALKAELDTEFDFSEQNKKFEKTLNEGLASAQTEQGVKLEGTISDTGNKSGAMNTGLGISGNSNASNDTTDDDPSKKLTVGGYNKVSGFFDSISCETLDPERSKKFQGSSDPQAKALREKQKQIDKETFGTSAVKPRTGSYNRGSHHRRGGGSHRGGYHGNNRFNKREA